MLPLSALPHLATLDLSSNRVVRLAAGVFRGLRHLRSLHLSHNRLSFMQRQSFLGLQHLERLGLARNDLSSRWLGGQVFHHLGALTWLDLTGNRLTSLAPLLAPLPLLRHLHASHNHLESLGSLAGLPHLEELLLGHNSLTRLETLASYGLRRLDLGHNKLERIGGALVNLTLLTNLNLRGGCVCSMERIRGALANLTLLTNLNLRGGCVCSMMRIGGALAQPHPAH